jgi:hypothetical protein
MEKYITLMRKYIEHESDEITKVLLTVCLNSLFDGIMPSDARVKFSLLTNSDTLLVDTTNFTDLTLVKEAKCSEIDAETAKAIILLAGDDTKQRNLTAKAVQLTLKVAQGSISTEESAKLDALNSLFNQIEQLRAEGNTKEAKIKAAVTQEEFDALCAQFGV